MPMGSFVVHGLMTTVTIAGPGVAAGAWHDGIYISALPMPMGNFVVHGLMTTSVEAGAMDYLIAEPHNA